MTTKPCLRGVRRNALAISLCLALSTHAAAQVQDTSVASTQVDRTTDLDQIKVTARKRVETIIEVPMNISVISASELNGRNISNVSDIYRTLAGGASPTGQLVLRGLVGGNSASPGTTSQFVDGIPFSFGNVFDIEQVEVLRGPQGTLWGSNAIGGTVQTRTRAPQFNALEAYTTLSAEWEKGRRGAGTRIQAGLNVPLIDDTLALRIAASNSDWPGKIFNVATGNAQESKGEFLRTQLRWQPAPSVDLTLGHIWTASDSVGTSAADRSIAGFYRVPELRENPASPWGYDVTFSTVDCPAGAERPACLAGSTRDPRFTIHEQLDGRSRDTTSLFSLRADVDDVLGIGSLHYVGSYRKNFSSSLGNWSRLDLDDTAQTWTVDRGSAYRTTHELRFQNSERMGGFDWTVGLFQDRSWRGFNPDTQWQYHRTDPRSIAIFSAQQNFAPDFTRLGIRNIAELGQTLYGDPSANYNLSTLHSYSRERAAFGELSYQLETGIGTFEFAGGLRAFEFEDSTAFQRSGIWFGINADGTPYFSEAYSGEESGSRRKFSVSYMPNRDTNIFAVYSEGYRPGGNNAPLASSCAGDDFAGAYQPRYNSDEIDNYEIGVKAALLDRRLRLSSAVYRIDWSGTWASVYMPSCGFSYTTNTPGESARSEGIEFESSLMLGERTMLTFNAGYTDSRMLVANAALGSKAGDDMTMVPRYNGFVAVDQEFQLFGLQAFARADVAAYGEYKSHFNTRPEDVSPAYRTVNLSGRLHLNPSAEVSVHLNNLFNEDYLTYRSARSRTSSRQALTERYGDERSVAVRFDYRF